MLGSLAAIWISMMLIIVLFMVFAVGAAVSSLSSSKSVAKLEKQNILYLDLSSQIKDRVTTPGFYDLISEKPKAQSLSAITSALEAASSDKKINGLYINASGASCGIATRQSIRKAIEAFRQSGKWVIAYGDSYTEGDYWVASAADSLFMNPVGMIEIKGLASGIPFFKGLMDKLGVEMQVVRVGTFKSAVEPFTLTSMSEANRLQTATYMNSLWNQIASDIASSRNISVEQINTIADSLMTVAPAEAVVGMHLADGLLYRDEMTDMLKDMLDIDHDDDLPLISIDDYLSTDPKLPHSKGDKKIAVYYAEGDITENGREGIASERVVPDILDLAADDDIDALVLRVNSGGGSAFASEQIWHALEVFKSKGKPFYVSMGDYAASGGYYISCGADKIFAEPTTITGSIGIFGMIPCAKELVSDKLGVNIDYVITNAYANQPNTFEPMSPFVRARLQDEVNRGYELFTSRCAEGRDMPQDSIKAIAEGRVWTGEYALRLHLVDNLGSLTDAISSLAKENNYKDNYEIIAYPNPKMDFWDFISNLETDMYHSRLERELGVLYPVYTRLNSIRDMAPVQARMEDAIIF